MKKKFGDYTYFEVAKECAKYEGCYQCPFDIGCYWSQKLLQNPEDTMQDQTYEKIITIEE